VSTFAWIAIGLIALSLTVLITIEWFRQNYAIIKLWTAKQADANAKQRQQARRPKRDNPSGGNPNTTTS
jgi:hypothetical protein